MEHQIKEALIKSGFKRHSKYQYIREEYILKVYGDEKLEDIFKKLLDFADVVRVQKIKEALYIK